MFARTFRRAVLGAATALTLLVPAAQADGSARGRPLAAGPSQARRERARRDDVDPITRPRTRPRGLPVPSALGYACASSKRLPAREERLQVLARCAVRRE